MLQALPRFAGSLHTTAHTSTHSSIQSILGCPSPASSPSSPPRPGLPPPPSWPRWGAEAAGPAADTLRHRCSSNSARGAARRRNRRSQMVSSTHEHHDYVRRAKFSVPVQVRGLRVVCAWRTARATGGEHSAGPYARRSPLAARRGAERRGRLWSATGGPGATRATCLSTRRVRAGAGWASESSRSAPSQPPNSPPTPAVARML